jgi:cytochrome P450
MGVEQVTLSAVAEMANRPRLSAAVFRFTNWGNPFAPERFSWPYPMFERMRADGEVAYGRLYRQWLVFGYDEVQAVLASPDTATAPVAELLLSMRRYRRLSPSARANFTRWLAATDAPDHTRLRSAVSRAFTPKQIARYENLVADVVHELIAELPDGGEIDMVSSFTNQLPIRAIAALLGLPDRDRAWLLKGSSEIGLMLEPLTPFDPDSMSERFNELDAYFTALVGDRRRQPGNDLISALVANGEGPVLDDDEIIAMIAFLLFAGHETVTGMLGNALLALARFPRQRACLRADADLIGNAIEELLRFDSPVQVSARRATRDLPVGGRTIKAGETVALMIGAANRDKRRWPDADELRLDRPDPKPISFGFGAHHCLGAALARMELRLALPPLLDRLGDYTVDPARIRWKRSFTLRGPLTLPVTTDRSRSPSP